VLNLKTMFGRGSAPQLIAATSRVVGQGRMLADAIGQTALPRAAEALAKRIETRRSELLESEEMLGAWERPWLATSPELQQRLNLTRADDRYETAITVGKACEASKPEKWCRALLSIVLATKAGSVVEMGTNLGISGLYIAAGLKVNGHGRLLTMEGAPSKAALAAQGFVDEQMPAEVVVGDFAQTLNSTLARAGRVDLGFIDGFHDGEATIRYHQAFKHVAGPGGVLVYDDINWSDGMKRAWDTIRRDPDVGYVLDYASIGVVGLS
jgi:predicted O-methyltransferase YrrM